METKRKLLALHLLTGKHTKQWRNYGPYKEKKKTVNKTILKYADIGFVDDTSYLLS